MAPTPGRSDPRRRTRGDSPGDVGRAQPEYDGELVVYDVDADRMHHLNPLSAGIWRRSDGHTTTAMIARELGVDESIVLLGVQELREANLITADRAQGVDRRAVLARLGAAVVLPIIVSMAAPTVAMAASPGHTTGATGNPGN